VESVIKKSQQYLWEVLRMQRLFSQGNLHEFLESRKLEVKSFVESCDHDELLKANEKWCQTLIEKFRLMAPTILEDKIETKEPERYSKDEEIKIIVPFEGDAQLLQYLPSRWEATLPYAEISRQELILAYKITEHEPDKLRNQIQQDIATIKRHMSYIKKDVDEFNASLERYVKDLVSKRKEEIRNIKELVTGLGFPVRRKKP